MRPRACLGCDTVIREDEPCASVLGGSSDGRSALVHAACHDDAMAKAFPGFPVIPLASMRLPLMLPVWYDEVHEEVQRMLIRAFPDEYPDMLNAASQGLKETFPQHPPFGGELPPGFARKD